MSTNEWITYSGWALAIVGLVLSIWQTLAAGRQTKNLKIIAEALSTKYLGTFPDYVDYIAGTLSRARHEILIISTIPVHGLFSAHEGWKKMSQALVAAHAAKHKIAIKCIFSEGSKRKKFLSNQFKRAKADWLLWRMQTQNRLTLDSLIRHYGLKLELSDLSFDDFIDIFETVAALEADRAFKGAEIKLIPYEPPMQIWVVDRKEAIFVVTTPTPNFQSDAFWTSDAHLINSLVNMQNAMFAAKEDPVSALSPE